MKKRFLGIICLLYSALIVNSLLFDSLKNFLAPQMQIYIKLSLIPMTLIGIVMVFNNNVNYRFKKSDLILLLPLVMALLTGNGRLTASFANNRSSNQNVENRVKTENNKEKADTDNNVELPNVDSATASRKANEIIEKPKEYLKESETNDNISETPILSNPFFNIIDSNYNELANYITFEPKAVKYEGKSIRVRGFALETISYLNDEYSFIGKYAISCCAADATIVGFAVKYGNRKIVTDKWYEIEGILKKGTDKEGYDIMYIEVINMKEISSNDEEQYVYPCYYYDDGLCESMSKYDLEY